MADAYGAFRFKDNCFQAELAGATASLPEDYTHDFAARVRPSDCVCVIRHAHHSKAPSRPRRCRSKRRLWSPLHPEKAQQCCQAHRARESQARAWMESNHGV